jgi:hypothetical protein
MKASFVLDAVRAMAGAALHIGLDGDTPRAHPVALAWGPGGTVDGTLADPKSHELVLAPDATVADLVAALDDAVKRDRKQLYVDGAPGAK